MISSDIISAIGDVKHIENICGAVTGLFLRGAVKLTGRFQEPTLVVLSGVNLCCDGKQGSLSNDLKSSIYNTLEYLYPAYTIVRLMLPC